jgi:hypothetical protein
VCAHRGVDWRFRVDDSELFYYVVVLVVVVVLVKFSSTLGSEYRTTGRALQWTFKLVQSE